MNKVGIEKQFLEQLESIISAYEVVKPQAEYDDLSDVVDYKSVQTIITRARAAITRISGAESAYSKQVHDILNAEQNDYWKLPRIIGVAESLKVDLSSGYLTSLQELLHGEVFGDFLEMADYLQNEGYKDAAAVIAGSTLEAHLRQLCFKNQIDVEASTQSGVRPKKADQLNTDLAKTDVYSKLDQKNVTAWLDLRNKAAHGHYGEYTKEQVALLIAGIRDFITRNPA